MNRLNPTVVFLMTMVLVLVALFVPGPVGGVLLMAGVVETTPADLWRGAAEYPWGGTVDGLLGSATEALRAATADSLASAVSGAPADSLTP